MYIWMCPSVCVASTTRNTLYSATQYLGIAIKHTMVMPYTYSPFTNCTGFQVNTAQTRVICLELRHGYCNTHKQKKNSKLKAASIVEMQLCIHCS